MLITGVVMCVLISSQDRNTSSPPFMRAGRPPGSQNLSTNPEHTGNATIANALMASLSYNRMDVPE